MIQNSVILPLPEMLKILFDELCWEKVLKAWGYSGGSGYDDRWGGDSRGLNWE